MKVLLIDVYNFNKGGAETVCFNTGRLLEVHGHDVIYFTLKWADNHPSPFSKYFPESKETRRGSLRQVRNMINYFYHFEAAKKIERLILDERPDIAHIHLMWGQITPSIFPILRKYGIPILFTVHDYRIVCPAYTFRDGSGQICEDCQGKYFYKCIENKCCKNSYVLSAMMAAEQYFRNTFLNPAQYIDGFIYVSRFAKSKLEEYMPALRNKPNIVLYNLADRISQEINKTVSQNKYFLFFGRLSYEKGIKTLIMAFKDCPHSNLKIVGTGPLERELKDFVRTHNIANIEFLGYKSGIELENIVRNAYFIVVPSEWYENNPMTIIEGYAVGTPVIGSDIGGIPEIVVEDKTGYLFSPGNVNELVNVVNTCESLSIERYNDFQQNALNFATANFNRERYYPLLMNFYKQFVK